MHAVLATLHELADDADVPAQIADLRHALAEVNEVDRHYQRKAGLFSRNRQVIIIIALGSLCGLVKVLLSGMLKMTAFPGRSASPRSP